MSAPNEYLILRLDAPMQSWGSVALDPLRPTHGFPTRSALAGMMASALGWRYRDGARTTALQDALRYSVREERTPRRMRDYQTADLDGIGREGWTRWGMERRGGGSAATGTHILEKQYLAGGVFLVALTLHSEAPVGLSEIAEALARPARPLFLGRKGCIPASPILVGRIEEGSPYEALQEWPVDLADASDGKSDRSVVCWYEDGDGPDEGEPEEIWDRRDFSTDRFGGSRTVRRHHVRPRVGDAEREVET